jgi:hypothetical protein
MTQADTTHLSTLVGSLTVGDVSRAAHQLEIAIEVFAAALIAIYAAWWLAVKLYFTAKLYLRHRKL